MSSNAPMLNVPHVSIGNNGEKIITPFGPMIHQSYLSDDVIDMFTEEADKTPMLTEDYNLKVYKKTFIDDVSPIILGRARSFMDGVVKVFGLPIPPTDDLSIESMWINYQEGNDTVPMHTHFFFLQFVIYCDVPQRIFEETGRHNPMLPGRISLNYGEDISPLSNQTFLVTPERGMMLIFPGKLNHTVYPFYSDDVRVSVAGSIVTKYPH
jgi:hypothetical protein